MRKMLAASDSSGWLVVRRVSAGGWFLVAALVFLALACPAFPAQQERAKNVLVIDSFSDRTWDSVAILKPPLRARISSPVNFYSEYAEIPEYGSEGYEQGLLASLKSKYRGQPPDLVVTVAYPALQFAVKHRDELFPGVPIVFTELEFTRLVGQKIWPGVTGVTIRAHFEATIDLALRLHPDTNAMAVITSNNSEFDRYWLAQIHTEILRHPVKEIDLVGLPADQLIQKVAALPPRTVALFFGYPQGSVQPEMGFYEILTWVGQRLPTYCFDADQCLIYGGIGGAHKDSQQELALTVDLAARVLSGERPDGIPVVHETAWSYLVDWRQLRRWHINEAALPPGTVVANREPTLWERGRKYFLVGIAVIVLQALLIFGLFWQRARKRRAEAMLRESEGRFRLVANNAPVLIWMSGVDKLCTYFNETWLEFTGRPFEAECGNRWVEGVHPDDLQECLETYTQCFDQRDPFRMEFRLRRHDGVFRWIMDLGVPRFNSDGSFAGYIGSAIDVTDQKLADEALQRVSGQLIEAQEKERRRIARDLHDDICQKLALLSIDLRRAHSSLDGSSSEAKEQLEEIHKHCSGIALDVQSLSHQLHSSKLDYLGLTAAVRGFCRELAKQHEINIDFKDHDVPKDLPSDISLCLFRVSQEALYNAVKYSGTKQFEVKLNGAPDQVQLVVSDAGAGFEVEEAKEDRGLGLVSMQERMNLVHGRFHIESKIGEGTIIVATVPLIAKDARLPLTASLEGAA